MQISSHFFLTTDNDGQNPQNRQSMKCAHQQKLEYIFVSRKWRPLASHCGIQNSMEAILACRTQLYAHNDWAGWLLGVNSDDCAQSPITRDHGNLVLYCWLEKHF